MREVTHGCAVFSLLCKEMEEEGTASAPIFSLLWSKSQLGMAEYLG